MTTKIHIALAICGASLALPFHSSAQLNESVSVDGRYVPDIIKLDRINTFPSPTRFSLDTSPLGYETAGVNAAFNPSLFPMVATGWRDMRKLNRKKGYVELGMGSWLNSTLSAGYRIIDDENTSLGVRLQHNSTSLWKPKLSEEAKDFRQYRYDENIGVWTSHLFAGLGRLNVSADYHFGSFNYYGFIPELNHLTSIDSKTPSQKLNDFSANVGWASESGFDELSWNASLSTRHFAYSDYPAYTISRPSVANDSPTPPAETRITLGGGLNFPTSTSSAIGLNANFDLMTYSSGRGIGESSPRTYGMISLTPFYSFKRDNLNVRLGADVELAPGIDNFALLHFAPDVCLDYKSGFAGLFAHFRGGSTLNTLASGYEIDYYQGPQLLGGTRPVYTPLDAEAGANFGPFSGFSASVALRYRISRNVRLGGWEMANLNFSYLPMQDSFYSDYWNEITLEEDVMTNLHGVSMAANVAYSVGSVFSAAIDATYQPQKGKKGYFNGYDRARWTAGLSFSTRPIKPLEIKAAYKLRGGREIYFKGETIPMSNNYLSSSLYPGNYYLNESNDIVLNSMKLSNISTLNLGASWTFTDSFSVWLQGDNLLNRHEEILPMLPSQGISVVAGLEFLF